MTSEKFDAVIIGAGFGGMGAAVQLNRLGYDNLAIIDRVDDVGGTWHVNHYPGLAVDIPSTTYSYWFEPNPYWSRLYAPGVELKRYAEHVADKYNLRRYMRLNTTVDSARWDEDATEWVITLAGGEMLRAQFLIAATGYLCQPRMPEIPGIDTFAGKVIHAAQWDDGYSMRGRRVGVIGTGSSAVQIIPELAKEVAEMTVYQRTPIWVLPKLDFNIAPLAQRAFARVPRSQHVVRRTTDIVTDLMVQIAMWKYRYFKAINKGVTYVASLHRFISIRDKNVRRALKPNYAYGCKRPTLSNTYYRAYNQPNVHLETSGIQRIDPDGLVTRDGNKRVIDTLVLATGFDVWNANLPAIEVIGRDGRDLGKWWRENKFQAYEGLTVPAFPNFMSMSSPYSWVGMSWFDTVECQMRHMNRVLGELQRRGASTFEVTDEANTRFLERMTTLLGDSVFMLGGCAGSRSYWFNESGEAPLFRPTTVRSALKEQEKFPLDDYAIA